MKIFCRLLCALLLLAGLLPVTPVAAVTLGVPDDFEDGTTQGWLVGLLGAAHPAPPVNVASGGPAGVGDNFLLLTALGGQGAGSRLTAINVSSKWAGDYLAAGVGVIVMDVKNFEQTDLYLRLLVADPIGGPPVNVAFSSKPVTIPSGSDWTMVQFPITETDLTAAQGDVLAALTNVTELRIFQNFDPIFPGPPIIASLGVDNITAVPLPSTLILLGSGLIVWPGLKRKIRS